MVWKSNENISALGNASVHLLSGLVIEEVTGGCGVIITVKEKGQIPSLGCCGFPPSDGRSRKGAETSLHHRIKMATIRVKSPQSFQFAPLLFVSWKLPNL
jgi:hypothetical protein